MLKIFTKPSFNVNAKCFLLCTCYSFFVTIYYHKVKAEAVCETKKNILCKIYCIPYIINSFSLIITITAICYFCNKVKCTKSTVRGRLFKVHFGVASQYRSN